MLFRIHEFGMCSIKPSFMDQIKQWDRKEKADVKNSCFRTCCFVPFVEKLKTYSGIHVPASLCWRKTLPTFPLTSFISRPLLFQYNVIRSQFDCRLNFPYKFHYFAKSKTGKKVEVCFFPHYRPTLCSDNKKGNCQKGFTVCTFLPILAAGSICVKLPIYKSYHQNDWCFYA